MKKTNKNTQQGNTFAKTIQILKLVSDVQDFEKSIESVSDTQTSNPDSCILSDDDLLDIAGGLQDDIPFKLDSDKNNKPND